MIQPTPVRIIINHVTDTTILDMGKGVVVPFTYTTWGGTHEGIKRNFAGEVSGEGVWGVECDYDQYEGEINHPAAVTIYTAADGWLI